MVKILFYCTKEKPNHKDYEDMMNYYSYSGKLVASADCKKVEEIHPILVNPNGIMYKTATLNENELERETMISNRELREYLGNEKGYAIYLENINLISESFRCDIESQKVNEYGKFKAPQNMMRVKDKKGNKYLIIAIYRRWLEYIIGHLKTIEVRKKITNELKEIIKGDK